MKILYKYLSFNIEILSVKLILVLEESLVDLSSLKKLNMPLNLVIQ